jgi:hypothetical protein
VTASDFVQFGSLIVNSVCRGTSGLPGNEAWKIPFGLFFVIPVVVMVLIFGIPEVRLPTGPSPSPVLTQA